MNAAVENFDYLFRIIVVGDSGVGKSNILLRYIKNEFDPISHSTIGVDFSTKTIKINSKVIKAQIWDTAGQDRFRSISTAFYRGSAGALIVFDLTNPSTFVNLKRWIDEIKKNADPNIVCILVGNKCDLRDSRAVNVADVKELAAQNNMSYIETSALDSTNIETAFVNVLTDIYNVYTAAKKETENSQRNDLNQVNSISLENQSNETQKNTGCC